MAMFTFQKWSEIKEQIFPIFPNLSLKTFVLVTGSAQYKGFADCLAKIYRQEGIRGWYKVSALLNSHRTILHQCSLCRVIFCKTLWEK